jgi:hypothetical protein
MAWSLRSIGHWSSRAWQHESASALAALVLLPLLLLLLLAEQRQEAMDGLACLVRMGWLACRRVGG